MKELDKESDKQLLILMDKIQYDIRVGVDVFFEYIADYNANDTEDSDIHDEFITDWENIVSSAFHAPWVSRHQPLSRQIDRAIDYVTLKRAKEALK